MKVGDLVIEKTKMSRKPEMGIVLKISNDVHDPADGTLYPYQIYFFDNETCWMQKSFLELISEN